MFRFEVKVAVLDLVECFKIAKIVLIFSLHCTLFRKAFILSGSCFNKSSAFAFSFFVKTQRIRNKPSNFTNFLLYNQIILHKRGRNQSSGSIKSLHWLISFAAYSLISGQHGRLNNFCSNMLKIMFFCTF